MPVFAVHIDAVADLVIACVWAIAAALYWLSAYRHSAIVSDALKPVRLFGMWLSLSWSAWYIALFAYHVEQHDVLHGITDGLIFVTATYIILVSVTSTRTLRKLGVK